MTRVLLDTHVIVWLYAGLLSKISPLAQSVIESCDLYYSPICKLELAFLHEIKRIKTTPKVILNALGDEIGLSELDEQASKVIEGSLDLAWTRDPFDRILIGHADLAQVQLVTADRAILGNYEGAVW